MESESQLKKRFLGLNNDGNAGVVFETYPLRVESIDERDGIKNLYKLQKVNLC